jgi:large subunit ribosomal protein L28
MAYRCELCSKGAQAAHNVSHSNRKSRKWQMPNLQRVHVVIEGVRKRVRVCTRCIRSGKITKAAAVHL